MKQKLPIYTPFRGVLPQADFACEIIAPPYDVLSSEEAYEKAKGNPKSFLHISKAEIDLKVFELMMALGTLAGMLCAVLCI